MLRALSSLIKTCPPEVPCPSDRPAEVPARRFDEAELLVLQSLVKVAVCGTWLLLDQSKVCNPSNSAYSGFQHRLVLMPVPACQADLL